MTDTSSVYTMRELNLKTCTFTKPEKLVGYHESFININGSKGFVLQSPKLVLSNSTNSYFEFLISRNKDRHKEFYNIISHLEDSAIIEISQSSEKWFGREIRRDQVETMFRSSIHRPLEINDPYILRINKSGNVDCELNYPVVCLIKIDGIIFGKNSSKLDMKVVQIKVIKTEKIPSDDDYVEQTPQIPTEKPFYNDNASVIPSNFNHKELPPVMTKLPSVVESEDEKIVEKMIEKVDDDEQQQQQQQQKTFFEDMVNSEKMIEKAVEKIVEKVPENVVVEPPSPVKSIQTQHTKYTVQTTVVPQPQPQPQPQPPVSIDSIKCEIMKAMTDNDFQRVKELSALLQKHKLGTM